MNPMAITPRIQPRFPAYLWDDVSGYWCHFQQASEITRDPRYTHFVTMELPPTKAPATVAAKKI